MKFKNISFLVNSMDGEENFFKIYSGLPLEERKLTIIVLDGEPINWNLASQEIKNNTSKGQKILKTLKELELI